MISRREFPVGFFMFAPVMEKSREQSLRWVVFFSGLFVLRSMWKLFKKKKEDKKPLQLVDLDGQPIMEGDEVISLRYELGRCRVEQENGHFFYQSLEKEERVSFSRMVDAVTGNQKVQKK